MCYDLKYLACFAVGAALSLPPLQMVVTMSTANSYLIIETKAFILYSPDI